MITDPAMSFRSHHSVAPPRGRRQGLLARAVSWLVVAALLGMMVMPMAGAFAGPAAGVTLVTICSDHGIEQIALDAEGKTVPLQKAHQHQRACPFCLSHSGGATLPAGVATLAPPLLFGQERAGPARPGIVPEPVFLSGRQTRAPPV